MSNQNSNEDPVPMDGVETVECSLKEYNKSVYDFRDKKRRVHRKNSKAMQTKYHRRKNAKKSKMGIKPESGEESLHGEVSAFATSRNISEITLPDTPCPSEAPAPYRRYLDNVMSRFTPPTFESTWNYEPSNAEKEWFNRLSQSVAIAKTDDKSRLVTMVMMTMNYFASLILCQNWKQVASCTSQFVIPLIPPEFISLILNKFSIQPEAGGDEDPGMFDKFISSLREARLTMVGLASVPFIKQISRVVALITMSGLTPGFVKDSAFLSEGLEQWTAKIASANMWDNFLELIVGSIEFTGEFLLAWKSRTFDKLIMPSDVHNRCVRVLAYKDAITRGEVEKVHNKTNAQIREEAGDCIKEVERLIKTKGTPVQERFALSRYTKDLLELQNQIDFLDKGNKMREEPLCIIVYGEPSVGKSGIMFTLIRMLSVRYKFDAEDENIWYPSKGDEYDSGYNGKITTIIDDDRANETKDFIGKNGYARLLQWINIVPAVTVQADIEKKSRIPYDFKLVMGSTNNMRMNVEHFAVNQLAHLRRCIEIEVRVKPQYTKDIVAKGKTMKTSAIDASKWDGDPNDPFHEMHEMRMIYWTQQANQPNAVCHYGEWLNAPDAYHAIIAECDKRKQSCLKYLDTISKIREAKTCTGCGFPKKWCRMDKEGCSDCQPESGVTAILMGGGYTELFPGFLLHALWKLGPDYYLGGSLSSWLSGHLLKGLYYLVSVLGRSWVLRLLAVNLISTFVCCMFGYGYVRKYALTNLVFLVVLWILFAPRLKALVARKISSEVQKTVRGMPSVLIAGQVAALGASAYLMYTTLKTIANLSKSFRIEPEGRLQPISQDEVRERCSEENPWLHLERQEYVRPTKAHNMTHSQVVSKLTPNLLYVRMLNLKGTHYIYSNMFIVQPGVGLLPHHALEKMAWRTEKLHMVRKKDTPSSNLEVYIHNAVRIGKSDFVLVQLTGLCSFTDALEFLPENHFPHRGLVSMVSREKDGDLTTRRINHTFSNYVYNGVLKWPGSYHYFPPDNPTSTGDCCSFLVAESSPPIIVGFHMGGAKGKAYGCSHQVTRKMILDALATFPQKIEADQPIPLPLAEAGEIEVDRYGSFEENFTEEFHPRAVVNFAVNKDGHPAEFYPIGTIKTNRSKYISDVRISPMSPYLEELGRPLKWGKPQFASDRNHADHFQIMTQGEKDYPPYAVDWAVRDYIADMEDCLVRCPPDISRPLTIREAINGIPGQRFIGSLNMKTSSGYGLKGKKSKHFENIGTELNPEYVPTIELRDEVARIISKYERGIMDHPIARSGLKDEPTKIGKKWVRVFSTLPVSSLLVAKMWLMPLINFFNSHPLTAETAVGINCTNDEWHEAGEWLDELPLAVEGDYSKYDIRQNGQLMRAFTTIVLEIARKIGYSARDLRILQTIMFDNSATTWMYAGTLFKTDGSMPSGALSTIFVNGGGNSLRKRIFYRMTWPLRERGPPDPFRERVHALTMGDDSADTTDLLWYNAREMQLFFGRFNMPFTDSNKSEIAVPNVHFRDLAFCKRKWRMDVRLRKFLAPIELDSIFKSLHCVMKSNTPIGDIMIGNVDNALRELARHDQDTFEENRTIIRKVLRKMHMEHLSRHINTTYEEWGRIFFIGKEEDSVFDLFFDAVIEDEGGRASSL